ncbi:MAG TPA: hypothetical protein VI653_19610 [Steroidobacteraceae bacterium]
MTLPTGAPACVAYRHLVEALPEIGAVKLVSYTDPPPLQDRLALTPEQAMVVARARALKSEHAIPFWDGLFRTLADSPTQSRELLSAATFHQTFESEPILVSRDAVRAGAIEAMIIELAPKQIGFLSEVVLHDHRIAHVPMLDFQQPCSPASLPLVTDVARLLFGSCGIVLESGNSYHAVGLRLVSEEELRRMLAQALMFGATVDRRYIGHQLIEGRCCLRLSKRPDSGTAPRVAGSFQAPER